VLLADVRRAVLSSKAACDRDDWMLLDAAHAPILCGSAPIEQTLWNGHREMTEHWLSLGRVSLWLRLQMSRLKMR
jgi:hypothetical protein